MIYYLSFMCIFHQKSAHNGYELRKRKNALLELGWQYLKLIVREEQIKKFI